MHGYVGLCNPNEDESIASTMKMLAALAPTQDMCGSFLSKSRVADCCSHFIHMVECMHAASMQDRASAIPEVQRVVKVEPKKRWGMHDCIEIS